MLNDLSAIVLPSLMIAAAMTDVTTYKIPNWLTGGIALAFFPMALLTGMPMIDFAWHLAAGGILFAFGYLLFSLNIFGGGDSKLMAAAGLWFGVHQTLPFLTMTAVAGGVLAVAFVFWGMMSWWFSDKHEEAKKNGDGLRKMKVKLPYGVAFAIGALLVWPDSFWMTLT
jgi:prepilin peptidase CpaA